MEIMFDQTVIYWTLQFPVRLYKRLNIYSFIMACPFLLAIMVIMVPVALIVDAFLSLMSVFANFND